MRQFVELAVARLAVGEDEDEGVRVGLAEAGDDRRQVRQERRLPARARLALEDSVEVVRRRDLRVVAGTAAAVLGSHVPGGADVVHGCVRRGLLLDLDDDSASRKLRHLVESGPAAPKTRLKNAIHALAVRRLVKAVETIHRPPPAAAVGVLWKRGEGAAAGWRKRHVALLPACEGGKLYYFGSERDWHAFRDDGATTSNET